MTFVLEDLFQALQYVWQLIAADPKQCMDIDTRFGFLKANVNTDLLINDLAFARTLFCRSCPLAMSNHKKKSDLRSKHKRKARKFHII
jgi:hypothetical protein